MRKCWGRNSIAPRHPDLLLFHAVHIMAFMPRIFAFLGFIVAASHFSVLTLFAAAFLFRCGQGWFSCKGCARKGQRNSAKKHRHIHNILHDFGVLKSGFNQIVAVEFAEYYQSRLAKIAAPSRKTAR